MTSEKEPRAEKTPREKLAELLALRKAASSQAPSRARPGQKVFERAAAASSAAKSKPAARKG